MLWPASCSNTNQTQTITGLSVGKHLLDSVVSVFSSNRFYLFPVWNRVGPSDVIHRSGRRGSQVTHFLVSARAACINWWAAAQKWVTVSWAVSPFFLEKKKC